MKQKIQYLDDARTLAILWVVLVQHNFAPYGSHFGWVPNGSYELFNSDFLHISGFFTCMSMPICFFIAGIVAFLSIGRADDKSFVDVMKKKAKRLLLPAVLFGIIFQLIAVHTISYKAIIGYMHFWFIIDLFLISLIFLLLNKKIGKRHHVILTLCAVIISSLMSNRLFNFCSGYFFYLIGYMITAYYKRNVKKSHELNITKTLILFSLSVLAFLYLPEKTKSIVEPLFAIPVLVVILKNIKLLNNACWLMLCKYSYGIYIFHMLYLYVIYYGLNCGGANSYLLENACWVSTLIALITIPLSAITTYLINKTKLLKI